MLHSGSAADFSCLSLVQMRENLLNILSGVVIYLGKMQCLNSKYSHWKKML